MQNIRRECWRRAVRDFWRGLRTPDFSALLVALGLLVGPLIWASILANEERIVRVARLEKVGDEFARASVIAMQGPKQHAAGPAPTLLFAGPSALRYWLPTSVDAAQIASDVAGHPVNVLILCGDAQIYPMTAALLDRFGSDFNGTIIIGVNRQILGRFTDDKGRQSRSRQVSLLGFDSTVLDQEMKEFGYPERPPLGWHLWDHSNFYVNIRLGFGDLFATEHTPHWHPQQPENAVLRQIEESSQRLSMDTLEDHLALLERVVKRVRKGRANIVLVEVPWSGYYLGHIKTKRIRMEDDAYDRRMTEWSRTHQVKWITAARSFDVKLTDFLDVFHMGSEKWRRRLVQHVALELEIEPALP